MICPSYKKEESLRCLDLLRECLTPYCFRLVWQSFYSALPALGVMRAWKLFIEHERRQDYRYRAQRRLFFTHLPGLTCTYMA
jgi:hypothetical protein